MGILSSIIICLNLQKIVKIIMNEMRNKAIMLHYPCKRCGNFRECRKCMPDAENYPHEALALRWRKRPTLAFR